MECGESAGGRGAHNKGSIGEGCGEGVHGAGGAWGSGTRGKGSIEKGMHRAEET